MTATASEAGPLLQVRGLKMHFPVNEGMIARRHIGDVKAVDGGDFPNRRGANAALVGEGWVYQLTMALQLVWLLLAGAGRLRQDLTAGVDPTIARPTNDVCLGCHGTEGFQMPRPDGKMRSLYVNPERFGRSVHGKRLCVECPKDIQEIPHRPGGHRKVS